MKINKKKLLYIGLLAVVFILSIGMPVSYCSDHFNFTSGDIQNFYTIMRDNSLWYSSENDTNYHNTVVSRWESGDEIINNLSDNDWTIIETMVNDFLEQYWITSGEYYEIYGYNEYGMNDSMVWILVSPAPRTTDSAQINILFIPYETGEIVGLENRSSVSGDYAFHTSINAYNYNMDGTALSTSTTNALVSLQLKADGTYGMYTNRTGMGNAYSTNVARALSNIHFWYRRDLPNPYYEQNNVVYYIGLLKTCRNNQYSQLDGAKTWQYKGYNFYNYKNVYNGFIYNLDNKTISSGDNASNPSQPSGEQSGGSVDLTETNTLISGVISSLTDTPSSGDFGTLTSGDIMSAVNIPTYSDNYLSFWSFLLEGLKNAIDLDGTAVLPIDTAHYHRVLYSTEFKFNYPTEIADFLPTFWTVIGFLTVAIFSRKIYVYLTAGNALEVAHWLSSHREDISNLL